MEGWSPLETIAKKKIIGIGNIGITFSKYIKNILLVDGLKHNLLSIVNSVTKGIKSFLNLHYA